MFCGKCGARLQSGDRFCSSCGSGVEPDVPMPPHQVDKNPSRNSSFHNCIEFVKSLFADRSRRQKGLIALGIIGLVIIGAIIISFIYTGYFANDRDDGIKLSNEWHSQMVVAESVASTSITDGANDTAANSKIEFEEILKKQIQTQCEQFLSPLFDSSNFRVTTSLILNFDRVSETQVEFAPPSAEAMRGVIRDQSLREFQNVVEYYSEEYWERIIDNNNEISGIIDSIEREQGVVESINVAILIVEIDSTVLGVYHLELMGEYIAKILGIYRDSVTISILE